MTIHAINPLLDPRWDDLVARHERASVFHERGWLKALAQTYGYEPFVLTSAEPRESLQDGAVLCRVSSWLTGTRWVSLPFSDHCEPLLNDASDWPVFADWLAAESNRQKLKYVEVRPLSVLQGAGSGLRANREYCVHTLDLQPSAGKIFQGFHKDCVQRRIRHAEKAQLTCEVGNSEQLAREFYRLLVTTRKRHRLLPQPRLWVRNLTDCMGDKLQILLARKNNVPVAALLTLRHGSTVVYKYGCSNDKFHHLGGIPFLFWRLVEESKTAGVTQIDLGRSDLDQEGLLAFKDRLGATRRSLTYFRYPATEKMRLASNRVAPIRRVFGVLPDILSSTAGRILYRHVG